ncbi:phage protease [Thermus sp. PS18]|uniref:phage protease n=1 Tax=Thermus sp. PS18 TaxID=2849039 RepID=UPI00226528BD|nr:phage protease [Thermus sp. PS18]UZX16551.1 phage protease [Thermus sp. PS18]
MTRHSLTLELPVGEPPREFRIWPYGEIETTKGTFLFTREDAERVYQRWLDYGNRLSIDYEHQTFHPVTNGPVPAAGWFSLEVREDGLWAVEVEWTSRAAELLRNREYRYFSPTFHVDEEGRIVELINLALTNLPATKRMEPLVAKAVPFEEGPIYEGETWDADAAVARVRRWASRDGSGDKETIDWEKYRKAFAWYDSGNPESFGSYKLPHHDVVDGKLVVHKRGVYAAAAALQGARGGVDIPESELEAVRRHIARHYRQMGERAPWEREENRMERVKRLLGLREDASEAEAEAVVLRLMDWPRRVMALTGKTREDEAEAVILAWKQAAEELPRVQERLSALEEERRRERLRALIEKGKKEGKLTPAMLSWAESQTPEALEAFLAVAPRVVRENDLQEPELGGLDWNAMTPKERAELYQKNPEAYRALRRKALGY